MVCCAQLISGSILSHVMCAKHHNMMKNLLVVRSNSANAWRASKYMSIGNDDL